MSIRGLLVGPKTNSPNYQHMNCIAGSKRITDEKLGVMRHEKKRK